MTRFRTAPVFRTKLVHGDVMIETRPDASGYALFTVVDMRRVERGAPKQLRYRSVVAMALYPNSLGSLVSGVTVVD